MDDLKTLLGDDLFSQVQEKIGDRQVLLFGKDQKAMIDDGSLIPRYRLDEVTEAKKALESQVAQAAKDLTDLKRVAKGNEELTGKIEELQEAMKAEKAKASETEARMKKAFTLKESLLNAGVADSEARDLLSLKFDLEKIEIGTDGKIKDFETLVKPIKENKVLASMFGGMKKAGQEHAEGDLPDLGEYAKKNPFAKETRNIALQVMLQKEKPDVAARLRAMAQTP
jgi:predicted RNase H-like nuclease (RuvC/YqgF family)